MSALDDRMKTGTTNEGLLRLGSFPRMQGESTVDLLKRQKTAIMDARDVDQQANVEAYHASNLRREIEELGHKPAA